MASAEAGATLSLVDNELIAFETATLTGTERLRPDRPGAGVWAARRSPIIRPARRSPGSTARWSNTICRRTSLGQTLYFKFQSFNVFGGGLEDLSTLTVYTFTPAGAGSGGSTGGGSGGRAGRGRRLRWRPGGGSSDPIAAQL